jgi:hypothetical protein
MVVAGGAYAWRTLQIDPVPRPVPVPELERPDTPRKRAAANLPVEETRAVANPGAPVTALDEPEPPPTGTGERERAVATGIETVKTKDRLMAVTARCDAAEDAYRRIKNDSLEFGQTPHPSITQAWSKMRQALDQAQRELDRGDVAEARASLDLAEAAATRVIRAAGGS